MPQPTHKTRSFTGAALAEVAFPLGGIGTGTVSLGGRGNLRDWEIFNHPAKGFDLPYTFFALWAKAEGEEPVARVLERRLLPPFTANGSGTPTRYAPGLPRMREATFTGEYPFAWLEFQDERVPLEVSLEAFNPMVPLEAEESGLPVAIFTWRLRNAGDKPVEASLAFSLLNAAGTDGRQQTNNRGGTLFGKNWNELVRAEVRRLSRRTDIPDAPEEETWRGTVTGIRMTTAKVEPEDPKFSSLAVATPHAETTWSLRWERAGWWDDLQNFWDDFSSDGRLPEQRESDESPEHQTDVGTVAARVTLAPGESIEIPFILAWHVPNLVNQWNGEEAVRGKALGNHYATRFRDAWHVAEETVADLERLRAETARFHETLFASTVPAEVLDAVSSQMSIMRTTTCLWTGDGRFNAFEGCNDQMGCCPMNCTHVWNYSWTVACLYPQLERTMRLTDFGVNTREDGRQAFRTLLPLSPETLWGGPPAADGQMGTILKLYREWQFSGDDAFLRDLWPHAKRSLQYAWCKWDEDKDGVMEGEQHNTYDIEFYGPNTMMGSFYLAALRAGEVMATHLGEADFATECRRLYESGREKYDQQLWNGEYYVQTIIPPAAPAEGLGEGTQSLRSTGELRYQYGPGCLSDQLLGQWWAHIVGLGDVLPSEHVKSALSAIYRHNFRSSLVEHESCQRLYAVNDEAGLLLCTWPNGGRPAYPFPYADEVWTGIEYQVAAHLIHQGMVQEGLAIVKGVRDRHDGIARNPWNEFECGHHYARAMASWSVLLALSGFSYSAVEQRLGFAPRVEGDFACFFSTGSAWGLYRREGNTHTIEVRHGELTLRRLELADVGAGATVTLSDHLVEIRAAEVGIGIAPVRLRAGEVLRALPGSSS